MSGPLPKLRRLAPLCSLLFVAPALASASPPPEPPPEAARHVFVIPPGQEAKARALLAPVLAETPSQLRWLGPRINIERVEWWLMQGRDARASLSLSPAALADAAPERAALPRSESFAIQVTWAPGVQASLAERELMEAAVAAVQTRDAGGFYNLAIDSLYTEDKHPPLYNLTAPAEPGAVHRRWGLELGASALLVLFAIGITLRPQAEPQRD